MADAHCNGCDRILPKSCFHVDRNSKIGRNWLCKECANARRRAIRAETGNRATRKYEKTKRGFLMRVYRNMQSRVSGVQKRYAHLYLGKPILPREDFYSWALASEAFNALFSAWELSGYERRLTPSVDRQDPSKGYEIGNMEWVTMVVNSYRGCLPRIRKRLERIGAKSP